MFIYIGGIPGVGKTSVIKKIITLAEERNLSIRGLNEKERLYKITNTGSSKEYAKLPIEIRAAARKKITIHSYKINRKYPNTIFIRDDHFTAPKKNSYWIKPLVLEDKVNTLAYLVIAASSVEILLRRRARDSVRQESSFFDLDIITEHQKREIQTAHIQAKHLQIPFRVLRNNEGKIDEISIYLLNFIQKIVK